MYRLKRWDMEEYNLSQGAYESVLKQAASCHVHRMRIWDKEEYILS